MSFEFRPAVLEQTNVLVALAGPSGGGKTMSALRLARGLVGPEGRIAFIDTESRRALHYAKKFRFDHLDFRPPYRPDRLREAVEAAEAAGYGAIVIDSMSNLHDGIGGLVEWADELEARGVKSPGNWREPKASHRHLMNTLLQARVHLLFCLRADERIKIEKDPRTGKTVVVPIGFVPICEKRFMYEQVASFLLTADAPGIPRPIKLQEQHAHIFPSDKQITEEAGALLGAWASGGSNDNAPKPANENPPPAKPKGIALVDSDGVTHQFERAPDWIAAFDTLTGDSLHPDLLQRVWDANSEMFYRIERICAARNDDILTAEIAAIGRRVLQGLTQDMPMEDGQIEES